MASKYSFLVIKYPWPDTADDALRALKELSDDKVVKLRDAVAIRKTEKGKIKLHQTKDDTIGKGFVKGGVIGVLFAMLFGPVGWIVMGAAAGGLFASFDRGIKQKLLKELGENMTASESAVAILVESADWPVAVERMKAHGFRARSSCPRSSSRTRPRSTRCSPTRRRSQTAPDVLEIVAVAAVAEAAADVSPSRRPSLRLPPRRPATPGGRDLPSGRGHRRHAHAKALAATRTSRRPTICSPSARRRDRPGGARPRDRHRRGRSILAWVNRADLIRIPGVGSQYSDLLEAAGVDSPAELARRNAGNLATTFAGGRRGEAGHRPAGPGRGRGRRAGSRPPDRSTRSSSTDRIALTTRRAGLRRAAFSFPSGDRVP